jgi:uncharacterized protein (DUF433 family)
MAVTMQREQTEGLLPKAQLESASTRPAAETIPPITTNPARLGGTPVIGIERLPVEYLIGYLAKGGTVDEFVDEFNADRETVLAALQRIREAVAEGWLAEQVDF